MRWKRRMNLAEGRNLKFLYLSDQIGTASSQPSGIPSTMIAIKNDWTKHNWQHQLSPQSFWYQNYGKPSVKWAICLYWPLSFSLLCSISNFSFHRRQLPSTSLDDDFLIKFSLIIPIDPYEQHCARDRWCNMKFADYWVDSRYQLDGTLLYISSCGLSRWFQSSWADKRLLTRSKSWKLPATDGWWLKFFKLFSFTKKVEHFRRAP